MPKKYVKLAIALAIGLGLGLLVDSRPLGNGIADQANLRKVGSKHRLHRP